ncbi:MAG: ABC transporter ATP-binding protein [Magnetococcales bacterium]|nr:ABC transporter ATP-binding protein [Magnetococcales bacterium]
MNALEITNVSLSLDRRPVLEQVSLTIPAGSFFGLVGGNGAGKTTLLKCILDLGRPDQGAIAILGVPSTLNAARQGVAYLPERFLPPPYLTSEEFLSSLLRLHGAPVTRKGLEEALIGLDMDPAALRKPIRALSKGMTQKLGLAGCLKSGKPILLLDEPTSGLDPMARSLLKNQLLRLKEQGATVFINTHILSDVERLCDAMAILHQGRVRFHGSPAACLERFGGPSLEEAYLQAVAG